MGKHYILSVKSAWELQVNSRLLYSNWLDVFRQEGSSNKFKCSALN
uniref:Uncharacterized protein n=1 Tax=Anguilla anguilla TaxID=7936 RepID=A0A0E9WQQ7_ANGAN